MPAITLNSNIDALRIQRSLSTADSQQRRSFERLSSGLRINRASDDAAGLAIAAGLDSDTKVYAQAIRNINDGISVFSIADSALTELSNIVTRQIELAEQAANGSNSFQQRKALNAEANQLGDEFNRIVASTQINGRQLFDISNTGLLIQAGYSAQNSVSTLLGALFGRNVGSGSYSAATTITGGGNSWTSEAIDMDGDGNLDIVTAGYGSNQLSVILSNGNGTFKTPVNYAIGSQAQNISYGDFNNDGRVDLAVTNYASNTVSTLLGSGGGALVAGQTISGLNGPSSADIADVNGDGADDLVAFTYGGSSYTVALGNGNGTFKAGVSYTAGANLTSGLVRDFNNDGRPDIVTLDYSLSKISVRLGNGDGTFGNRYSASLSGGVARSFDVVDFNGDGYLDVASTDNGFMNVLFGAGNGSLSTPVSYSGISSPMGSEDDSLRTGDLNGDGFADVAVGGTGYISIFFGNGNGSFKSLVSIGSGTLLAPIIGDFSGDGAADIATPNTSGNVLVFNAVATQTYNLPRISLYTQDDAQAAISFLGQQLDRVAQERGSIGSYMSRLESAASVVTTNRESLIEAKSRITDVDVATEVSSLVRSKILLQASSALLAQANSSSEIALTLLDIPPAR